MWDTNVPHSPAKTAEIGTHEAVSHRPTWTPGASADLKAMYGIAVEHKPKPSKHTHTDAHTTAGLDGVTTEKT